MRHPLQFEIAPELREIVTEASQALACLDAERLEELLSCTKALNREMPDLARQARDAAADMVTFARVLEATRANLNVMRRLGELRRGTAQYAAPPSEPLLLAGGGDGLN